jgi:RNA polymerase sigma-54 factor
MAFRQDQKNSQKYKVSQSPQLIEAVISNEKSDLEIQDELDLAILTDADLEEAPLKLVDDEGVPDVDEDGRVNEDIEWDSYSPKDDTGRIEREIRQKGLPPLERISSSQTHDLQTHLMSQLLFEKMNVVQKEIGTYIIGNLDEKGYLETSIEELWQESQRYEIETWRDTLKLIQNFDPEGVAAKDLQECLLIQVRSKRSENKLKISENNLLEKIIKNHWDDFLNRKCDAIAKSLSVPLYDVQAAFSAVSDFDPRPGQQFNKKIYFNEETSVYNDSVFHIKPDFYVYKSGNDYQIKSEQIKSEHLETEPLETEPFYIDAIIGDYFYKKLENGDPLTQVDIERYLEIKNRFIAIYNRHKNTYSTIKSIVHFQKDFFDSGSIVCLRPLIARDVAKKINKDCRSSIDESTVRRIRKNKYIDTPHGIFELEFFFDRVGFDTRDGRRIASKGVKELIKNIIKSENKQKPYSDQKITEMLKEDHNIKIENRTVGKHREKLGLLSARFRKWPC